MTLGARRPPAVPGPSGPEDGRTAGWAPPPWAAWAGLAMSLIGFGVAAYLTYEHYTASSSLSCPMGGGAIDCLKVTTSAYSVIDGVPVAVLGLVFFAVMIGLQSPPAWRSPARPVRYLRIGWSVVGVATAVWLIYAELFRIDAICLWCTSVHILTLLVFFTTVFGTVAAAGPDVAD